jgi:hypothetical protein
MTCDTDSMKGQPGDLGSNENVFDFILPAALPSEKTGTFINADGLEQAFAQALLPCGDAWATTRPPGEIPIPRVQR